MILVQTPAKKLQCKSCEGNFILTVIKDSRKYKPYFYCCLFCGADVDSRLV